MAYLERKISKKAQDLPAKSMTSKVLIRILIILVLIIGVVKGCDMALEASRNAPIPDWKLAEFRHHRIDELLPSMNADQIDSVRTWLLAPQNQAALEREYREATR